LGAICPAKSTGVPELLRSGLVQASLCRVPDYAAWIKAKVLEGPRDAGLGTYAPFKMRHSLEALDLELFEESEQLVVRLVAFWSAFDGVGLGQGLFFQR
jgi:hypothetical protein